MTKLWKKLVDHMIKIINGFVSSVKLLFEKKLMLTMTLMDIGHTWQ